MNRGSQIKELREKMGMNRREFCDYYGIPYRTVQDWEAGKRELPDYPLIIMHQVWTHKMIFCFVKSHFATSRERMDYG